MVYASLKMKFVASCKSSNIVYVITCRRYEQHYVGETGQLLHRRVNNYRYSTTSCIGGLKIILWQNIMRQQVNQDSKDLIFFVWEWTSESIHCETCLMTIYMYQLLGFYMYVNPPWHWSYTLEHPTNWQLCTHVHLINACFGFNNVYDRH